jgi:hypothetical protein
MEQAETSIIAWLLSGDVAIQYQTQRDLLGASAAQAADLRSRIASEGWGRRFLELRDETTGLWGGGLYSPKWISTHYTLLDLKNLGLDPAVPQYAASCHILLERLWSGWNLPRQRRFTDLCVAAMLLSLCCYARIESPRLLTIVDYILARQFADGGWNCDWADGAQRSSLHTTLTVLEAFRDYEANGYVYRLDEIRQSIPPAWSFILQKSLFRSARTGAIIDGKMLMLSYPSRWKYDILRCLDYFASVRKDWDDRMSEALSLILAKQRKNGRWPVQQKYSGLLHFELEKTGGDSRWNTLRVLRVLKVYRPELFDAICSSPASVRLSQPARTGPTPVNRPI